MNKLLRITIVLIIFLGLNIFGPKNLKLEADTEPDYIVSLSALNGIYTVELDQENYLIYNDFQSFECSNTLINQTYLFMNDNNELKMNVVNGFQININSTIDLRSIPNGLFYFEYEEDQGLYELFDLKNHIEYSVIGLEFNAEVMNKCYYLSPGSTVYAFLYLENGVVHNISNPIVFFNMMTNEYHLFFTTNQVDYDTFTVFDTEDEEYFEIDFESDQVIPFYVGYIIYNFNQQKYALFDDEQMDSLLLDIIENQFDKTIYTPSIIDVLDEIFKIVDSEIKDITMGEESISNDPNGLYVLGTENKLYRIVNYEYLEELQDSSFVRSYVFFPALAFKTFVDVNILFTNNANNYLVDNSNFVRIYGEDGYFLKSDGNDQLVFFLDGVQIDISDINVKGLLWLYDSFHDHVFETVEDYNEMLSSSVPGSFTIVENYSELSAGDGFVKIFPNDNYYDAYFYNNGQYYKYCNMDLVDQLSDDISSYKINYHKFDDHLIMDFQNDDEHVYWDAISETYSKKYFVSVTGEKEFSYDQSGMYMLSYLHFNLNIEPDLIETVTFNYSTYRNYYLFGIKTSSSEPENITKTIKSFDFNKPTEPSLWYLIFRLTLGSNVDKTINESILSGYDWQVLLSLDFNNRWYSSIASNMLGITSVQRVYEDVVLMYISYWINGEFHENVVIDENPINDESPTNIIVTIIKNAIDSISLKVLKFAKENTVWFVLIVVAFLFILIVPKTRRYGRWHR